MEEKEFNELLAEVKKAVGKIKIAGLKGQALHKHLRAAMMSLRFKRIQKKGEKTKNIIAKMDEDVKNHLVTECEADLNDGVHLVIVNMIMEYLTGNGIFLFEQRDLKEVGSLAKGFRISSKGKLDKETRDKVADIMEKAANEWKEELEALRKMLNSIWAKANDREGWALSTFATMHKEGFFIRYQERKRLRDAIMNASQVEKMDANLKKFKNINSKEDLIKQFTSWWDREKHIVDDYKVLAKMLFNTWAHTTEQLGQLLNITVKAQKIHELPQADADQMMKLHNAIIESMDKELIRSLRIEDKQLEAIYADVMKEVEGVRKAA